MELFNRNHLFKLTMVSIFFFPIVSENAVPFIGASMGLYFIGYLSMQKDALNRLQRARKQGKLAYSMSFFLFILIALITVIYSQNRTQTLWGVFVYLSAFALFIILKYEVNRPNHMVPLLRAYFISTFVVGFYHFGQIVYDEIVRNIPFDPVTNFSFMENAPSLAYFMLIPLFPALVLYIYKDKKNESRFYLLTVTVALITIFMSGSRIAVVGVFIGLVLLSLLYSVKFLIALIPAGIFAVLIPIFTQRHDQYFLLSVERGRFGIYLDLLRENAGSLFFGKGFFTFDQTFNQFMEGKSSLLNLDLVNRPYDMPIQIILEIGFLGLLAGAVMIFFKMRALRVYTKSTKGRENLKVMYVGVTISMIVLLFVGAMDSYLMDPKIIYSIAILMGIMHGDGKYNGIHDI